VKKLSKNKNISILKQDKGRGVVIINKSKYIEKCMALLNTDNFQKIEQDNTKEVEESVQKALFKVKEAIGEDRYKQIYPSGSNPGKFYGTAKIHKVKPTDVDKIGKLPIRPIVSNIGTATHKTAQYLCRLLAPLAKSKYTIENTKDFVNRMKKTKIPEGYKMISFDVVSLFTNVPLHKTVDIILEKVYNEKLIKTRIKKENMKELLLLCTKDVPFTSNDEVFVQVDGVMMGSPLGPLFANIFMCELENEIVPKLENRLCNWMRYVDDTFGFIKPGDEIYVQEQLNAFHQKIQFTYEMEENGKLPFLDVLITRQPTDRKIETSVYRKQTNTDIYMNWKSHAPSTWKIASLKSLLKRAFLVSSTEVALEAELKHLKNAFCNLNDYPIALVDAMITKERTQFRADQQKHQETLETTDETPGKDGEVRLALNLPYAGATGEKIVKKMQKYIKNTVNKDQDKVSVSTMYRSKRLSTKFNIKDKTKLEHMHNVVYHVNCPNKKCKSHYGGQTKCRMEKRGNQHREKDKKSHVYQHTIMTKHKRVSIKDFKILGQGYRSDFRRRISESLFVKKLKPDLNIQKDAYRLALFN
jgi:hypothetical protein